MPSITTQPVAGTICTGGTDNLTVAVSGGISLSYLWYNSSGSISSATTSSYSASTADNYYCIVSSSGSGCSSVTSNTVAVTVNADPSITTQPLAGTICTGGTDNLTIAAQAE